jgi:hypothetical protein
MAAQQPSFGSMQARRLRSQAKMYHYRRRDLLDQSFAPVLAWNSLGKSIEKAGVWYG